MNRVLFIAGCLAALGMGATPAQAEGFYGGLSAGISSVEIDEDNFNDALTSAGAVVTSSETDEKDVGFKAYLGYQFNPYFAVEGGYVDLGSSEYKADFVGGDAKVEWQSAGIFFAGVGRLPMGDKFAMFGKAGAFFSNTTADISASGPGGSASDDYDADEVGMMLGIGAEYQMTETIALRAEWERFLDVGDEDETGEGDIELLSVGVTVSF